MKQQLKERTVFIVLVGIIAYPTNYILETYDYNHWIQTLSAGMLIGAICAIITNAIFKRNKHFYCNAEKEMEREDKCQKQCGWCKSYCKYINKK